MQTILSSIQVLMPAGILLLIIFYVFSLRRIVPTNVVHIVQRGSKTVSYGVGTTSNVYYQFPKWLPIIGVDVRVLPVSNFDIDLLEYSAYDKDKVPFVVDVKAFFHISDTNKAAQKVESFEEMKKQLENVVQGAIRSILAKFDLEKIMEERSIFGDQFTESVRNDLQNWGVEAIKNIELMDVRDAEGSSVIHQIMAKRMSAIDMESRTEVAKNKKAAVQAELEAQQEIDLTKAKTQEISGVAQANSEQAIGIAKAESIKQAGIAKQNSITEVAKAERISAEQEMEVAKVRQIKQTEINKDSAIILAEQKKQELKINTEAEKFKVETEAEAQLSKQSKFAEGIKATGAAEAEIIKMKGTAEADAKQAMELANVTAQTTLAEKIGENESYQNYLIRLKEVEVSQIVGVAQAEANATALSKADLKLLVNSGDVHSGLNKLSDIFTSKGGAQITGLLEALKQTEEGKSILAMLDNFKSEKK